jgi:hypothetical protein
MQIRWRAPFSVEEYPVFDAAGTISWLRSHPRNRSHSLLDITRGGHRSYRLRRSAVYQALAFEASLEGMGFL